MLNLGLDEQGRKALLSHYFAGETTFVSNNDEYEVCVVEDDEGITFCALSTWDGLIWGAYEVPVEVWVDIDSGMSMAYLVMVVLDVLELQARHGEVVSPAAGFHLMDPLTWSKKEIASHARDSSRQ